MNHEGAWVQRDVKFACVWHFQWSNWKAVTLGWTEILPGEQFSYLCPPAEWKKLKVVSCLAGLLFVHLSLALCTRDKCQECTREMSRMLACIQSVRRSKRQKKHNSTENRRNSNVIYYQPCCPMGSACPSHIKMPLYWQSASNQPTQRNNSMTLWVVLCVFVPKQECFQAINFFFFQDTEFLPPPEGRSWCNAGSPLTNLLFSVMTAQWQRQYWKLAIM